MTRTIDEVRDYLRTQVNHALRRLGMYGDELSLILLFDALAFAEGIDEEWKAERDALRERGVFWPTGVRGAISSVFPDLGRGDSAIASVYAEFAHRAGWLTLDRILREAEHQELLLQVPGWCGVDRTMSDLTATLARHRCYSAPAASFTRRPSYTLPPIGASSAFISGTGSSTQGLAPCTRNRCCWRCGSVVSYSRSR